MIAVSLGRALPVADLVVARLRVLPDVALVEPVGDIRRGEELIERIEIVATAAPSAILQALDGLAEGRSIRRHADRIVDAVVESLAVRIYCPSHETVGASLLNLTGSPTHLERLRTLAAELGT